MVQRGQASRTAKDRVVNGSQGLLWEMHDLDANQNVGIRSLGFEDVALTTARESAPQRVAVEFAADERLGVPEHFYVVDAVKPSAPA